VKNPRAVAMIVISVVIGLFAVIAASQWITQQAAMASTKVVVTAVDIELGSKLTPQMLKTVDWPSAGVPPGAVTDVKLLDGRVVKTSITRGEPVLEARLAPVGTKGGLSAVVAEGKRAMTVRVNDVIGVAGFALPGNYVDILVNTQDEMTKTGTRDHSISKIVLERILVLAVAQEASRDDTKPKVVNAVTLEVTPEQAEKLDLARSVGSLSLVLRNQIDPNSAQSVGATKLTLLRDKPEPPPAPVVVAAPEPPKTSVRRAAPKPAPIVAVAQPHVCVEVIRGMNRHNECF
jgi:pilus assembly protein CpaB